MKNLLLRLSIAALLTQTPLLAHASIAAAPQPTDCIAGQFSSSGNIIKIITLKLSNNCGKAVDFQNTTTTFQNKTALNTPFMGTFDPLPAPDNELQISSQKQSDGSYLATFNLHFPTNSNTQLPTGKSISIKYAARTADYVQGSTKVYLSTPVESGSIELTNTSAKPANVAQNYALVHITLNNQKVSDVQLPWSGKQTIPNLAIGNYNIAADMVTDTNGNNYKGTATPAIVDVKANQTALSQIAYAVVQQTGAINIQLQALPPEISSYTGKPVATLTESGGGSSVPVTLEWGTLKTASKLKTGTAYNFSTPIITHNGFQCQPTFDPVSLVASEAAPTTQLTYRCSSVAQSTVTINVSGGPTSLSSLTVTFTPNNNGTTVNQAVSLNNGSGTSTTLLTTGLVYNLSSNPVSGYVVNFNPQPLTAANNAIETVTLSTGTPVSLNGQLKVCGTQLCNEHGQPIQLRGMSTHGLQWYGLNVCLTQGSLDALAKNWNANVMRISMYVQEGGYEKDPAGFTKQVNQLIEEASKRGIYAIVDFHQLNPGDPNYNLSRAQKFFTDIATANKDRNNLLYEICNEPNGVSWSKVKTYADKMIPLIRAIDPKTVILVGTHGWGSLGISDGRNSQDIINNPVNFPNIMYTFHFYAASHKNEYLQELDKASNVLPIFVSEWGTQQASGDGGNDFTMSQKYIDLMTKKKIGWTNWNYSDDFRSGAVWKDGTCSNGPWTDARLKPAGTWVKERIKG